jgi:membrane-associated protein
MLLFAIMFLQIGVVLTPFLPGDVLLFFAGTYANRGCMNLWVVLAVFMAAALTGDHFNYWLGGAVGHRLFSNEKSRFFKKAHLQRTHEFFERYGGKTVMLARFVPIVRTFAPFVAGMGRMTYRKFLTYSVVGAAAWIGIFVTGGYVFARSKWVEKNMALAALLVVAVSLVPATVEIVKQTVENRRAKATAAVANPGDGV